MRRAATESSFPYWVALGSLSFALVLFFANTVPALREQESLRALRAELEDLKGRYEDAIRAARSGAGPGADQDLQSLLVAIDQQGYTPSELCAAFPGPSRARPEEPDPR